MAPPGGPTASTETTTMATVPAQVDSTVTTRPRKRRLADTGSSGRALAAGGTLIFLGGLLVAARPGRARRGP